MHAETHIRIGYICFRAQYIHIPLVAILITHSTYAMDFILSVNYELMNNFHSLKSIFFNVIK